MGSENECEGCRKFLKSSGMFAGNPQGRHLHAKATSERTISELEASRGPTTE